MLTSGMWTSLIDAGRRLAPRLTRRPWATAIGLVLLALGVRSLLTPVWGSHHAYTAFYPAVLLSAYLGGRRTGLLATALSALVGYWAFLPPAFAIKLSLDGAGYAAFFTANCLVGVLLIAGLSQTLARLAQEHERSRARARDHANLFRDINDRVSHHLHLVASLLALQAREEPQARLSDALARASEVSIALSRGHREWSGVADEPVAVLPFAAALLQAKLVSQGLAPERVRLEGEPFVAPASEATSLGVAFLECVSALLARGAEGTIVLRLEAQAGAVVFRVSGAGGRDDLGAVAEAPLLRAAVQQAGGRLALLSDATGDSLRIAFPGPAGAGAGGGEARLH